MTIKEVTKRYVVTVLIEEQNTDGEWLDASADLKTCTRKSGADIGEYQWSDDTYDYYRHASGIMYRTSATVKSEW